MIKLMPLAVLFIAGCATSTPCAIYSPIYISKSDVDLMSDDALRQVISHNKVYSLQCKSYIAPTPKK